MGNSTETQNAICKGFMLTSMEAEAFIYYAAVVTFREVHDHYDVPPSSVYGKSLFHGYPATWEIKASGTGSISLLSGERF